MSGTRTLSRSLLVTGIAALLSACADNPVSLRPIETNLHVIPVDSPELEFLSICKAGPAGTYTFQANATHLVLVNVATGMHTLSSAAYSVTVAQGSTIVIGGVSQQGACATFTNANGTHSHVGLAGGTVDAHVTVTETGIPAGVAFDHVVVYQNTDGTVSTTSSAVNSATGKLGGNGTVLTGAAIVFHNVALPVFSGNSINVQQVVVAPVLAGGAVTSFSGSFLITAFDQPVTVNSFLFKLSRNGAQPFWTGTCTTVPGTPLNVAKSTAASVAIPLSCPVVGAGPTFKKGDDVKLEVQATLATGRVFSNSGFYKVP